MERIKLSASEGMILTNGEAYGTEINLGSGDCPDNWREITKDEFEEEMKDAETANEEATEADYQDALREMGVKV